METIDGGSEKSNLKFHSSFRVAVMSSKPPLMQQVQLDIRRVHVVCYMKVVLSFVSGTNDPVSFG